VVIETFPVSGSADVDPTITELRATFSKPVYGAAWCQLGDDSVPETTGPPRYVDERTCVLPVRLQPGRVYALWLNTEGHLTFRDHDERPAVPYLLVFQTKP
jgi:RNA polymerase sigma-70 factor (ECF subfamily)